MKASIGFQHSCYWVPRRGSLEVYRGFYNRDKTQIARAIPKTVSITTN